MPNIITVNQLTKKFKKFTAVEQVSFTIKEGEIFGLLGPNGAGKSTIIRMLVTLLRPTAGSASLAGYDIVQEADKVRAQIGLVAEKIILYNQLTARENLQFFGRLFNLSKAEIDARSAQWVEKLHMQEWLNTPVAKFSTGMKQRINIIRALLTKPKVLFLDEPTLGLDPQTTHLIREFIQALNKEGVTILLTTHDMIEAEALCNRVAIIDHGKISALDTVTELKKKVPEKSNPTLEDVFLSVTGLEIRDAAGKAVASSGPGHFGGGSQNRVR